jgi:Glycosyltransferases, probably involved in cell wall biogenesis
VYVAERLIRSVSELDYPQELLQIQVLDDSTDETREITAACARNCASAVSTSSGSIGLIGPV